MKIACISDLHGELLNYNFSDCQIVIIAGDFSKMYGFGKWHLKTQVAWIQNKFFKFTNKYPNTQFIVVPGNHDLCLDKNKTYIYTDINWTIDWPDNVKFLIDSSIELYGLKFYGTPYIPIINKQWAFEKDTNELNQLFSKIPLNLDFLITHTPPRISNTCLDFSIQTQRGPFGSIELAAEIFIKQPKHVICGHIHSGTHGGILFDKSMIYNVSILDENYNITYNPTILEL